MRMNEDDHVKSEVGLERRGNRNEKRVNVVLNAKETAPNKNNERERERERERGHLAVTCESVLPCLPHVP